MVQCCQETCLNAFLGLMPHKLTTHSNILTHHPPSSRNAAKKMVNTLLTIRVKSALTPRECDIFASCTKNFFFLFFFLNVHYSFWSSVVFLIFLCKPHLVSKIKQISNNYTSTKPFLFAKQIIQKEETTTNKY